MGHILGQSNLQSAQHSHLDINIELVDEGGPSGEGVKEQEIAEEKTEDKAPPCNGDMVTSPSSRSSSSTNFDEDLEDMAEQSGCMNVIKNDSKLQMDNVNGSCKINGKAEAALQPTNPKIDIHVIPPTD